MIGDSIIANLRYGASRVSPPCIGHPIPRVFNTVRVVPCSFVPEFTIKTRSKRWKRKGRPDKVKVFTRKYGVVYKLGNDLICHENTAAAIQSQMSIDGEAFFVKDKEKNA